MAPNESCAMLSGRSWSGSGNDNLEDVVEADGAVGLGAGGECLAHRRGCGGQADGVDGHTGWARRELTARRRDEIGVDVGSGYVDRKLDAEARTFEERLERTVRGQREWTTCAGR